MRKAYRAGKEGAWVKRSVWASVKVRECNIEAGQKEEDRKSTAQQILQKSTDFLRRIIAAVEGNGGATLSHVCPGYSPEDHIWWVSLERGEKAVQLVEGGVRRPVRLKKPAQSPGHTRQFGPP